MDTMQPFDYASAMLQMPNSHSVDYILTAALTAFGTVMSIIVWFIKRRMEAYDKHLEECSKRAITTGRMDERLKNVEKNTSWVGNCVMAIGTKVGADLPSKPE